MSRPGAHLIRGSREIRLGLLFSPVSIALFVFAPLLLLYVVTSESVFASEFQSRKALSVSGVVFFALAIACFVVGARAGGRGVRGSTSASGQGVLIGPRRRSLAVLLEASLVISLGAYVIWFARGIVNAGGIPQLLEIWRTDPHRIKAELLTTIPGVTTLTQLAVAAIPLAIAFGLYRRGSALRVLVALVFAFATVRAVLFNERLALVELMVPVAFLLLAPRRVSVPRVAIYAATFVVAAMTLFTVTELRRTYVYTNDFSAGKSATRFFGYYLTSVNNGMVVIDEYPARTPFYTTGELIWLFPGIRDLRVEYLPGLGTVSLGYADAFGVDPETFWPRAFAAQGLDYEFNVFTAPGYLAADFGWAALIALFLLGLVSGRLYRQAETSSFHRAFYAIWLVGLLEFMRFLYVANTRVFPVYLVLGAAYLIVRRSPAWRSSRAESLRPLRIGGARDR